MLEEREIRRISRERLVEQGGHLMRTPPDHARSRENLWRGTKGRGEEGRG